MSSHLNANSQPTLSLPRPSWVDLGPFGLPGSVEAEGYAPYLLAIILMASVMAVSFRKHNKLSKFPVINSSKNDYLSNGRAMLARGMEEYGGKPFRVNTGLGGGVIILNPSVMPEVRNDHRFDSTKFLLQVSFKTFTFPYWQAGIPGFEPYIALGTEILHNVIKWNLTPTGIAKLNKTLSDETDAALRDILTDNEEWHEVLLGDVLIRIVARVSSVIFLGPELCRNPDWLKITVNYTNQATYAAKVLRRWPVSLYRIIHWFLPECQEVRAMVKRARDTIAPILEKRRAQKEADPSLEFHDALDWYEAAAKKMDVDYDPAAQQLGLSVSAILTSNDLMSQSIMDLCQNSHMLEPLRNEIRSVLNDGGWKPTTLYNMKLLDSTLKETLRLKPVAAVGLGRRVMSDVRLKDGTLLPKESGIAVSAEKMWDPEIYEKPRVFDGYRFLRMREASEQGEKAAQLVSTSPDHLGFGLGIHACPGRFFGANTVKLIMCHLLLKYDIRLAENTNTKPLEFGFSMLANPTTKVLIKRRKEEVHF
ncbi:Dihydromonacolin L monooxygenase LovA 2 [Colletotrichum chlorophyti]|uniref:Dihydromonacolin L monooxygenase LovA 2 n=1 Tax=Colletotrichum chlorophyti TaxID=708187 RepID=A0A1Q8S5S6_9PEZI|nr:Dihydromonacolin L monooxygenase LovA 2 [Colletotrichum chlorophyti]